MPSVWNFVGVEARTALTAYVFQVSTASGGTTTGLRSFAEAIGSDASQRHDEARENEQRTSLELPSLHRSLLSDEIASTTRNGSSPARCATSAASRPEGASKTKKQISSSGTWIERSKRTRRSALRQLLGGRACPPLAGGTLTGVDRGRGRSRRGSSACPRRYDRRVARGNVRTSELCSEQPRASSVRERTSSLA